MLETSLVGAIRAYVFDVFVERPSYRNGIYRHICLHEFCIQPISSTTFIIFEIYAKHLKNEEIQYFLFFVVKLTYYTAPKFGFSFPKNVQNLLEKYCWEKDNFQHRLTGPVPLIFNFLSYYSTVVICKLVILYFCYVCKLKIHINRIKYVSCH